MDATELNRLKAMSRKIEEAEKAVRELQSLGDGAPVIEKNVRSILSITHALRFGICDLAEMEDCC
jgi:hypothetical protein